LEVGLNFYYVVVGFYGWYLWLRKNGNNKTESLQVTEWRVLAHVANIFICVALTIFLGRIEQKYTTSPRPFFDAVITVFGFSATIMEARKILSAWIYWFVINGATAVLMLDRGMDGYVVQYIVLTALCVKGYLDWRKSKTEKTVPTSCNNQ
jgi:nicotinamide mononucleotide transporter